MIHPGECLVLAGWLHDERAVSEHPGDWRPREAHVGDFGQWHHVHGLFEYASGEQKPCRSYYKVIFEPRVDAEKQPDDQDEPGQPDDEQDRALEANKG